MLGEVSAIRSTISDRLHGSQRVMLTLRVERYLLKMKLKCLTWMQTVYLIVVCFYNDPTQEIDCMC